MKCQKCQKMAVLNSFDNGSCLNCGEEISTAYMPCDKVCESCSEKYKICQSCGESMDLKKKFGIAELLTEYAYNKHLEPQLKAEQMDVDAMGCKLYKMCLGYSIWLNETKLTPELVEKLFKGFERSKGGNYLSFYNGSIELCLFSINCTISIDSYDSTPIQTLADLARLTAAKPIPLA